MALFITSVIGNHTEVYQFIQANNGIATQLMNHIAITTYNWAQTLRAPLIGCKKFTRLSLIHLIEYAL